MVGGNMGYLGGMLLVKITGRMYPELPAKLSPWSFSGLNLTFFRNSFWATSACRAAIILSENSRC
jgi:hypothetical protein